MRLQLATCAIVGYGSTVRQPDAILVAAAGQGDVEAQHALIERLLPRVRRTVRYLAWRSPELDDIIQTVLIEILESCVGYRGESPVEAWADRIATRTTLRLIRRRRLTEAHEEVSDELPEYPMWSHDSELPSELGQKRRMVADLLARLPVERRVALVLKHVHGYSIQEVADATQTKVNTVRDRLRVARGELRKWLLASRKAGGHER
jgi:RNA polymerase sigma-70 factor (ECF subfamily)